MPYFHISPQKVHVSEEFSDKCVCDEQLSHTLSASDRVTSSKPQSTVFSRRDHRLCLCQFPSSSIHHCERRYDVRESVRFSLSNLRTFLLIVMKISEGWKPLNAFNLSKCLRRAFNMSAQNSLCNLIVLISSANGLSKR